MGKQIIYSCDGLGCSSEVKMANIPDQIPKGWYTKVSHMGRTVEYLCPECYRKMCKSDNGFLGGD